MKFFLWKLCHEGLATKERLSARGIKSDLVCCFCGERRDFHSPVHGLSLDQTCMVLISTGSRSEAAYNGISEDWLLTKGREVTNCLHTYYGAYALLGTALPWRERHPTRY